MVLDSINSKEEFIQLVDNAIARPDLWKDSQVIQKVATFIETKQALFDSIDRPFYQALMKTSHSIYRFAPTEKRFDLALNIKELASQVLHAPSVHPQFNLSEMPPEIKQEIFARVLQGSEHIANDLKAIYALSKEAAPLAATVRNDWKKTSTASLKLYGCKTAKEAVEFAIKAGLKHVNLSEFPDLTESDLQRLFNAVSTLDTLIIKSRNISRLPAKDIKLQTLICANCGLTELPSSYTHLRLLDCSGNRYLRSIPESYTQLVELNCAGCRFYLNSLPANLHELKKLNCSDCGFASLPNGYTQLRELDCSDCDYLANLPESYTLLQKLKLSRCYSINQLPSNYTLLEELDCAECGELKSLPESYAHLKKLNCKGCRDLSDLPPSYVQLTELNCTSCFLLRTIPAEYNQLVQLLATRCFFLGKLASNYTNLAELDVDDCPCLNQLPESYAQLAKIRCGQKLYHLLPEKYKKLAQVVA